MTDSPEISGGGHSITPATSGVDTLRRQIDALDEGIIRLVAERAKISDRIQTARMHAGGTRTQLCREREILDSYRQGLGDTGPALGDVVLQLCRGDSPHRFQSQAPSQSQQASPDIDVT